MYQTLTDRENAAIKGTPGTWSEISEDHAPEKITPESQSNPHEWFYAAACSLLGKDAGYALHTITGYPESTCYTYVAKDALRRSRPKEHFLRVLFADRHVGESFHAAYMADCSWWLVRQREAEIGRRVLEITK